MPQWRDCWANGVHHTLDAGSRLPQAYGLKKRKRMAIETLGWDWGFNIWVALGGGRSPKRRIKPSASESTHSEADYLLMDYPSTSRCGRWKSGDLRWVSGPGQPTSPWPSSVRHKATRAHGPILYCMDTWEHRLNFFSCVLLIALRVYEYKLYPKKD